MPNAFFSGKRCTSMIDTVYILSAGHSGSTLLNLLLGTHSKAVAVSELTHLPKNIAHSEMCSCGKRVLDCPIWRDVVARMTAGLGVDIANEPYALQLGFIGDTREVYKERLGPRYRAMWQVRRAAVYFQQFSGLQLPRLLRRTFDHAQANRLLVYEAVRRATGASVIVDASKEYLQGLDLYEKDPASTRLILLQRDGRAVYYSNLRRGFGRRESLAAWSNYYRNSLPVIRRRVLPEHLLTVRYEDLATDVETELRRLCAFLELEFEPRMLDPGTKQHHVTSGNDMRLKSGTNIQLDAAWRSALTLQQLEYFERRAGSLNQALGYD